jgi:hypothetical protein
VVALFWSSVKQRSSCQWCRHFSGGAWLLLDEEHAAHDHRRLTLDHDFPVILFGGLLAILPGLPRVPICRNSCGNCHHSWVRHYRGWCGSRLAAAAGNRARITNMAVTVVVVTALALLVGWRLNANTNCMARRLLATPSSRAARWHTSALTAGNITLPGA